MDISIISDPSVIGMEFAEGTFQTLSAITADASSIGVVFTEGRFEALTNIASDASIIRIIAPVNELRILPDFISNPSVIRILSTTMNITAGRVQDLPVNLSTGGMIFKFGTPTVVDEHQVIPWGDAIQVDEFTIFKPKPFEELDIKIQDGWDSGIPTDELVTIKAGDFKDIADIFVLDGWDTGFITDELVSVKYGYFTEITDTLQIPYKEPGPQDVHKKVQFGALDNQSITFVFPWIVPIKNEKHHLVPWGPLSYYTFCIGRYTPPLCDVTFDLERIPPEMIGVCQDVVFDLYGWHGDVRCPYQHNYSGRRDPYIWGYVIPHVYPPPPPEKETYRMMNTVLVKRLPDNAPIEVTSVNIKYDKQSWLWSFSLTIAKNASNYLDMIKPDPNNLNIFTDIEISVNEWIWTCRVESWTESRVFPKDSWTVQGRSPSMELGSPLNQRTSHIYDPNGLGLTAGAQIIDQVLEGTMLGIDNTDWEMDWTAYGANIITGFVPSDAAYWGIKPNTFSWNSLTQIEVIKLLTDPIGAFIMTKPNCSLSKKLIVRPMYNVPPWHWNTLSDYEPTINHQINSAYATEIGRSYESLPTYNAVYVMGQTSVDPQKTNLESGIPVVEIYRAGVGPGSRIYAPDFTNQWLTTWQACSEQGRMIISETGEWLRHSMRLFSLARKSDPAPLIAGLILPGDYVAINEKNLTWYGSVMSTEIMASTVNRAAFAVYQVVEVNEYIGN